MGETNKKVKVDNWGVFFLQRLQWFFNKTDYCDLTLQFDGNVQLKVHRLVMNACTNYFNVLENTCDVVDGNTIIMPDDLQADVIVPIVNFMYTGTLEFQVNMFEKLYHTAKLMNISILIKLLDAAKKKPTPRVPRQQRNSQTSSFGLMKKNETPSSKNSQTMRWKRKNTITPLKRSVSPLKEKLLLSDPLSLDNAPKPTRFEWPEEDLNSTFNLMENTSFDDISYTSKPLLTNNDELKASTSFDSLKNSTSYNNYGLSKSIDSDYTREQKVVFNDEDEDDPDNYLMMPEKENKRKATKELSPAHSKKVRFTINDKEELETTISVSHKNPGEIDHTTIISEVLKKYPHLLKKNKNIKLKILPSEPEKEQQKSKMPSVKKVEVISKQQQKSTKAQQDDEGPWICKKCTGTDEPVEFVLYYLYRKHMTDVHNEKFDSTMCKQCGYQSSKHNLLIFHQYTKHGVKPPASYNFPKCARCPYIALTETALHKHTQSHSKHDLQCPDCNVAFRNSYSLSMHAQITGHNGKKSTNSFDCQYCTKRFTGGSDLFSHIKVSHRTEARRDGIVSLDESEDFDDDDDPQEEPQEFVLAEGSKLASSAAISNESLKQDERQVGAAQPEVQAVQQTAVTTANTELINKIREEISANNLGIVDIVVLDENQQYILHNNQELVAQQGGQTEYILPELNNQTTYGGAHRALTQVVTSQSNVIGQALLNNPEIASTDELVMVLTDHDYNDGNAGLLAGDNSNIVVLYSHPVDAQQNQFITSEGKLLLNSQTGLLELRNTESAEGGDGQIESIELIQREINNGLIQQDNGDGAITLQPEMIAESNEAEVEVPVAQEQQLIARDDQAIIAESDQQVISEEEQRVILQEDPQMISQGEQQNISQGEQEIISEENQHMISEDHQLISQEEEQQIISEEQQQIISEDDQHMMSEENQQMIPQEQQFISQEEQQDVIPDDHQQIISSDNQQMISEENQQIILQENQEMISEENQEIISEENQEMICEENQEMICEENQEMICEENLQMITEENQQLISEHDQRMIPEDSQHVVSHNYHQIIPQDQQIISQDDEHVILQENQHIISQEHQEILVQQIPPEESSQDQREQDEEGPRFRQDEPMEIDAENVQVVEETSKTQEIVEQTDDRFAMILHESSKPADQEIPQMNIESVGNLSEGDGDDSGAQQETSRAEIETQDAETVEMIPCDASTITEEMEGGAQKADDDVEAENDYDLKDESELIEGETVNENVQNLLLNTNESEDVNNQEIEINNDETSNQKVDAELSQEEEIPIEHESCSNQLEDPGESNEERYPTEEDVNPDSMGADKEVVEAEEPSEPAEEENSQQSQDSQGSQLSNNKKDDKTAPKSESAKILILDDWEDTEDSQQSDNAKKGESVHNIIGDWDDDEDEGSGKS